ncbi:calcium-dependent protein kinase 28-like [Iris pallida]|uniref:Calcium-dependent protein kinase 28-like n=1 Tax=Iris pallida TaxID=29817 RepID=A0AAX6H8M3_IRIPA|nr:calcium-dependent protein kinase 28-like [Iris pallida]
MSRFNCLVNCICRLVFVCTIKTLQEKWKIMLFREIHRFHVGSLIFFSFLQQKFIMEEDYRLSFVFILCFAF